MVAGFGTTPEEMQRAAQHVTQVNEEVQAQLSALRNQLAPLAGAWRGEASTAFQGLMARWDADARTLNEALRGIGDAIQVSGRNYLQAESDHMQSMSAIRGALG
jgi:WXG100 family type VII secretion target